MALGAMDPSAIGPDGSRHRSLDRLSAGAKLRLAEAPPGAGAGTGSFGFDMYDDGEDLFEGDISGHGGGGEADMNDEDVQVLNLPKQGVRAFGFP